MSASVVALEEVDVNVMGVEVWISPRLDAVAEKLENPGTTLRLCQS